MTEFYLVNMPFFTNKFSPKKPPERKNLLAIKTEEPLHNLYEDDRKIKLKLGPQECKFENGQWIPGNFLLFLLNSIDNKFN